MNMVTPVLTLGQLLCLKRLVMCDNKKVLGHKTIQKTVLAAVCMYSNTDTFEPHNKLPNNCMNTT